MDCVGRGTSIPLVKMYNKICVATKKQQNNCVRRNKLLEDGYTFIQHQFISRYKIFIFICSILFLDIRMF